MSDTSNQRGAEAYDPTRTAHTPAAQQSSAQPLDGQDSGMHQADPAAQPTMPFERPATSFDQQAAPFDQPTVPFERPSTGLEQSPLPYEHPTVPFESSSARFDQHSTPMSHQAPFHPGTAFGGHSAAQQPHLDGVHASGASFGAQMPPAQSAPASRSDRKRSRGGMLAGALVLGVLIAGGAGLGGGYLGSSLAAGDGATTSSGPQTVTVNNTDSVNTISAVAAKVTPSVVTINVSAQNAGGSGSGVVLSDDGYVLTNTHVVTLGGATGDGRITATTSDGRIYQASVVGTDPTYDLAVIKLEDASGLQPISIGDSSKLNVGDQTIAIGAPLDLPNTVTSGIVSALNRSIQIQSAAAPSDEAAPEQSQPGGGTGPFQFDLPGVPEQSSSDQGSISIAVVQTDAAINPGNSGGALVNANGELVGINVAIASASGSKSESGSIGVGFSIPSNVAKRVADEIIDSGTASHGLLGATVQNSVDSYQGAIVKELSDGGAAGKAGLRAGDIITGLNGSPITNAIDLTAQVRALPAGAKAELTFIRDGETKTVTATLGELS